MRTFSKICPMCQKSFDAKRRNQLYCSPECRSDINNQKLKAKFNNIKTLENDKSINEKYKKAYQESVRVVLLDYDEKDKNEIIKFEGKKFKKESNNMDYIKSFGVSLGEKSVNGNSRIGIYAETHGLLCFMPRYNSYSSYNDGVTYKLIKKVVPPTV